MTRQSWQWQSETQTFWCLVFLLVDFPLKINSFQWGSQKGLNRQTLWVPQQALSTFWSLHLNTLTPTPPSYGSKWYIKSVCRTCAAVRSTSLDADKEREVVLSDWLEESLLDHYVQRDKTPSMGLELVNLSGQQPEEHRQGDQDDYSSAPFRFHLLVQHVWSELTKDDQLAYLGPVGQAKVKRVLSVLAAYGALREHPQQSGVASPQKAFSEMDIDSDGQVTFEEFVQWYSKSDSHERQRSEVQASALVSGRALSSDVGQNIEEAQSYPGSEQGEGDISGDGVKLRTGWGSQGSSNMVLVSDYAAYTGDRGEARKMTAMEEDTIRERWLAEELAEDVNTPSAEQPWSSMANGLKQILEVAHGVEERTMTAEERCSIREQWLAEEFDEGVCTPISIEQPQISTSHDLKQGLEVMQSSKERSMTHEEKNVLRERWLAGDLAENVYTPSVEQPRNSASSDLKQALEIVQILVKAHADSDTIIAALASSIIRNPLGRYNLGVIEEQFGPIIRGIVEDRLVLERLPEPPSSSSFVTLQKAKGMRPLLDMDDHDAKLLREFLVHSSKDARAVVVHMADLVYRLRLPSDTPIYHRQNLAIEALQVNQQCLLLSCSQFLVRIVFVCESHSSLHLSEP
ncbi:unnamed protein product [Choristocarpus tenellus]